MNVFYSVSETSEYYVYRTVRIRTALGIGFLLSPLYFTYLILAGQIPLSTLTSTSALIITALMVATLGGAVGVMIVALSVVVLFLRFARAFYWQGKPGIQLVHQAVGDGWPLEWRIKKSLWRKKFIF